jgi:hypothetical protein
VGERFITKEAGEFPCDKGLPPRHKGTKFFSEWIGVCFSHNKKSGYKTGFFVEILIVNFVSSSEAEN